MRHTGALAAVIFLLACGGTEVPPPVDLAAQRDSLHAWARALEAAFDRFEGCGGGDAARAFYSTDSVVFTTDSATMALSGEALTGMFQSVACTRKESAFRLDSMIVRSLAPDIGVVAATYLETATDTSNATHRLRGSVQWIVQRTSAGWKASIITSTEHNTPIQQQIRQPPA